jgi:hypothetical protein
VPQRSSLRNSEHASTARLTQCWSLAASEFAWSGPGHHCFPAIHCKTGIYNTLAHGGSMITWKRVWLILRQEVAQGWPLYKLNLESSLCGSSRWASRRTKAATITARTTITSDLNIPFYLPNW